ncbi:hypothetical protein L9F63_026121 [Diploptera punctata]|uniref:Uncharacterized protein n=1 Tax=Diploptera punctata TaxID=6984 RepID=A0AAD7Z538_DIPPU|nr:hypothetical protein L9F63_026121 [Diploptera punctata]
MNFSIFFCCVFLVTTCFCKEYSASKITEKTPVKEDGSIISRETPNLSPLITGNIDGNVSILEYDSNSVEVFGRSLINFENDFKPENRIFLLESGEEIIEYEGTQIKISEPVQSGPIKVGGPVINFGHNIGTRTESRIVVIGKSDKRITSGITISKENIDVDGTMKNSWGTVPLQEGKIPGFTGSALVPLPEVNGLTKDVIFPIERPTLPNIIIENQYLVSVYRLTILNIIQSNFVNIFSYLLHTNPVVHNLNIKMIVKKCHVWLSLRQINVEVILPYILKIWNYDLRHQLIYSLKKLIGVMSPEFQKELVVFIAFLQDVAAEEIFAVKIPKITAGIHRPWITEEIMVQPPYDAGNIDYFVNSRLWELVLRIRETTDIQRIKYYIYLVLSHLPVSEVTLALQIRNLAVLLFCISDQVWAIIIMQLKMVAAYDCYEFIVTLLELLLQVETVPQYFREIIVIIIPVITFPMPTKTTSMTTPFSKFTKPYTTSTTLFITNQTTPTLH